VYSIEYTSDLSPTNAVEWRCLAFLRLSAPSNLWVDSAAPRAARRFYRAVSFGPPTNMVFIPPGTFRMGSPTNEVDRDSEEGPQTEVTISRGFWMGRYKVTQQEYLALMGNLGSFFNGDWTGSPSIPAWMARDYGIDLNRPADSPECGVLSPAH
jgi:formylglycine-generating enzyme required for sulfatase activity